uniref:Cell division cycle protein 123 n=1 Tax=Asterionellopsis glacialis TaxID=33640 RepID=A0A7S0KZT8_9STRA
MDAVSLFDNDGKVINAEKVKYELVLRKWCNLHPSMEFRCFVFHDELLAISQRQHTQHFPHLTTEGMMYRSYIIDFFDSAIKRRFAGGEIPNYCFDVYIDKKDRVWLLDFNVWGKQTDSLLYDWHELGRFAKNLDEELASQLEIDALDLKHGIEDENDNFVAIQSDFPEFRVVETENEIRQDPLASYRAPIDTIELASNASGKETPSFEAFMAMCEKPSEIPEEDEDDQGSS